VSALPCRPFLVACALVEQALHRDVIEPGAAVLGRRIRAARRTAGLTQADLAGENASVAYISRIEAGQRRPSRQLLIAIADKLGVSINEFTDVTGDPHSDLRVHLGRAEQHFIEGAHSEAFALASEVAINADAVGLRSLGDQATYVKASAQHASANSAQAVEIIDARFGTSAGEEASVRVQTLLTRCYLALGQVALALEHAEQGARCVEAFGLQGLPEALEHAAAHSRALLRNHEPGRAAEVCRRAVIGSAQLTAPGDLASAYRSASAREAEAGAVTEAAVHFDLAQAARQIELYETYLLPLREQLSTRRDPD
jgi:transcriptional regulator with XRE-family HTH domain